MSRIRSVKPEFFASLDIVRLSIPARLHFIGLWTHVDDRGRAPDEPRLLKAALWPLDDDMTAEKIDRLMAELASKGRIVRYEANGRRYFQVNGWHHQKIDRVKESVIPEAPAQRTFDDESSSDRRGVDEASSPDLDHGSVSGSGSDRDRAPVIPPDDKVTIVFDAWTESTRRTGSKLDAKRRSVITAALKRYSVEDLIDAVRGWQHVPHNRGENERRTVYNDIGLLLKDAEHIERFRDHERRAPATRPVAPPGDSLISEVLGTHRRQRHLSAIEATGAAG